MKEIPLKAKALVLLGGAVGTLPLLSGCGNNKNEESVLAVGNRVTLSSDITGIKDYNALYKESCVLTKGTVVEIKDESHLNLPSEEMNCYYDKATNTQECYYKPNKPRILNLVGGEEGNVCDAWFLKTEVENSIDYPDSDK